jgi:transcriptional regulator with XRE-family HTH domain
VIANGAGGVSNSRSSSVGDLMRYWRGVRGLSQLDLALDVSVSQRHLSFVESGRSVPSRKLLVTFSDALGIPLRERNALLLAAGYAPLYQEPTLDDATMAIVSRAMDQMLRNHEPHPALLIDRYWNVIRTNDAAPALFRSLTNLEGFPKPRNLLELIFDPSGLRPCVEDWETVAAAMLQRVRQEALGQVIDDRLQALLEKLKRYPGADKLPACTSPESPLLPITFRRGDERISYFSLVTTVGMPQAVTAQELRLECMFPID